ncbi:putative ribonuclease H-like domain-containing protein [Tanacetum coccineum]
MTHPYPKRSFVPQAVLTRSGKLSTVNAVVNTVRSVNTANTKAVNMAMDCYTAASKQRHMTGNKGYLDEYEDYDGGSVSFGYGKQNIGVTRGTEFKNSIMNQFCEIKGIKREFSMAKTPQQNGVAKRKNRKLIKAARTMYSVVSKAMRVFNKRTRIIEETLNIRFLENLPNAKRNGPDWLFDIDSLSISMNYVPVVAGNNKLMYAETKDLHRDKIDKTLFIRRHKDDILLQVYVDDIIFGSTKKEMSTEFEKLMHDKFQMSSIGELSFFLGL